MKILRLGLVFVMLLLAPGYAFSAGLGYLRLSLIRGEVQVKTQEAPDWELAPLNMPLAEGDEIWVPAGGRAELQLNSGSYIRLDENSSLQVLSLDLDASQFYLPQGRTYVNFRAPEGTVLQLDSPDASTRAFSRASFGVDVPDSYTEVAVYKGGVETENAVGKATITAGQVVTLGQDSYGEIAPLGLASTWEEWNRLRDRRIAARASARYLPPELVVYSADLDRSGRWVYAPGYGYVWTPTVSDPDWSPYRNGRWIWRDGEYVWVADEQWGWAPYHYGRWAFISSIGWCWTPPPRGEVYWGPGYVGWVRTSDYVGWVPLAPGDTYYGRGYYGRNSVNVTNVNVTQVNINIYKNVQVNRGVTVVRRESFATPTPVKVKVDKSTIQRNLFTRSNIAVGGPGITPHVVTYAPSAKRVAPAKLPPQRIKELRVREVKEVRPLVKDPAKPVLAPKRAELPTTVVGSPRTPGKARPTPKPAERRGAPPAAPAPGARPRSVTPAPRGAAAPTRPEGPATPGQPAATAPSAAPTPPTARPARPAAPTPAVNPAAQAPRAVTPRPAVTPPELHRAAPPAVHRPAPPAERPAKPQAPVAVTPPAERPSRPVAEPRPQERRRMPETVPPRVEQPRFQPAPRGEEPAAPPALRRELPRLQPAERAPRVPPAAVPNVPRAAGPKAGKPQPPPQEHRTMKHEVPPGQEEKKHQER